MGGQVNTNRGRGRIKGSPDKKPRNTSGYLLRYSKVKAQKIKQLQQQIKLLNKNLRDSKKIYDERLKGFIKDFFESDIYEYLPDEISISKSTTKKLIFNFMELWGFYQTPEESEAEDDRLDKEMFEELERMYKEKNKAEDEPIKLIPKEEV